MPIRQHSDAQKQRAVAAMLTANREHPLSAVSIEAACTALGHKVHHATLDTWLKLYRATVEASLVLPTTAEIVTATRDDILQQWQEVRRVAMDQLKNEQKAKDAQYGQLVIGAGTAHDKIERMTGLPAEDVALWHDLAHTAALAGVDHRQVIQDMVSWLKSRLPTIQSLGKGDTPMDKADNKPTTTEGDNH